MKLKSIIPESVSGTGASGSDTEPDFGNFLAGGHVRTLGADRGGVSDRWYREGGYVQTEFPKADDIWGDDFSGLSAFNLDPGIWRTSGVYRVPAPVSWKSTAAYEDESRPDSPNTVDGVVLPDDILPDLDVDFKSPSYKDFFPTDREEWHGIT
jgi:hypothetical protein